MSKTLDFQPQNAKAQPTVAAAAAKCAQPVLEPKYDGWRILAFVTDTGVRLFSRAGKEYTGRVPEIEDELAKLPVGTVLDGEIAAILKDGDRYVSEWRYTQNVLGSSKMKATQAQRDKLTFIAFDYIRSSIDDVARHPIAQHPLSGRRDALRFILEKADLDQARVTLSIQLDATQEHHDCLVRLGFEGSMVKDATAVYAFGKRGAGWFKLKATLTADLVVMGYTDGRVGSDREGKIGSVILGQYKDGVLTERGNVNSGLSQDLIEQLTKERDAGKIVPRVVEVKHFFIEGDSDRDYRNACFLRFRDDKLPTQCEWEVL